MALIRSPARSTFSVVAASAAAYCVANLSWWMQPRIVFDVIGRLGVGEADAGLVATVEMASIALSATILSRFLGRVGYRSMALTGAIVAVIGTVLSIWASSYQGLIFARILTGLGEGAPLVIASAALARFADPEQAYARINVVNALFGIAVTGLVALPALQQLADVSFWTMLLLITALVPVIAMMPSKERGETPSQAAHAAASSGEQSTLRTLALVLAVFLLALMSGSLWSFYFVLGERVSLTPDQVSATISLAVFGALVGGLAAAWLGSRWGNLVPLTIGIVALSGAVAMISILHDPVLFRVGALLNLASLGFMIPYFLGCAAAQDPSGKDGALVNGSFLLTGAAGPYLGGILLETVGPNFIGWLVVALNTIAWLLFLSITRRLKRTASLRTA